MSKKLIKSKRESRLQREVLSYCKQADDINKSGIYCNFDDSDLSTWTAMIIGPKDTPYSDGFYFFQINFVPEFPFKPPVVKFLTYEKDIRFHPNLYVDGYVCLSILNTWGENEWAPCQSVVSILKTIQSILNDNPIINEPNYEQETGIISINYKKIISYYNIRTAILKAVENPPSGCEAFKQIVQQHFLQNYEKYQELLRVTEANDIDKVYTCVVYGMKCRLDYNYLKTKMPTLRGKLLETS